MRSFRFPFLAGLTLLAVLVVSCTGGSNAATSTGTPSGTSRPAATEEPATDSDSPLSTEEIVRRLRPSVVQVLTEGATSDIFGQLEPSQGIGTGVIIDEEGHIITNNHVVRLGGSEIASQITVTLADGSTADAEVVGTDPQTDLAVLKIDASDLTPAALGSSADLAVGEDVVAMGFALGLEGEPTVSRGVVSAKSRTIQEETVSINDAIQTDASINPGNSGGPLVDEEGHVVGINTAIISNAQNIGFSISIDLAKPIVEELIDSGQVQRGYLGVQLTDITPSLAQNRDLPVDEGVGIVQVVSGSPADEAGLEQNDIIVGLEDEEITNTGDLLEALRAYQAGDTVTVRLYRDDQQQEVEITLGQQPESTQ
ncbi:MAG: trypsin-like peptidase domain-containing protein [Dehalococcoidia bacterium]